MGDFSGRGKPLLARSHLRAHAQCERDLTARTVPARHANNVNRAPRLRALCTLRRPAA